MGWGKRGVVGSNFDQRRKAKANDGADDVADAEAAANEPELFGGVAAE